MWLAVFLIKTGIDDFVPRRPNWESVGFAGPLVRWIFGIFMAFILVYCVFKALGHLMAIGGADSSHKAKEGGMGLAFAAAAFIGVYFFYDLFVGLAQSAA